MKHNINVYSEIGKLNSIIIHRPGLEVQNIVPSLMEDMLFDEIPYLKRAQEEHDVFAQILRDKGVEVNYIEDLAADSITDSDIREKLIDEFVAESNIRSLHEQEQVREYLFDIKDNRALIDKMTAGILRSELTDNKNKSLQDLVRATDIFSTLPMPNLYFSRDTFALIGNGVCMNSMWSNIRAREALFGELIFNHHPFFKDNVPPFWYNKHINHTLEGGDIIVLSEKVIAIGISQRTEARSIEIFAENILSADNSFETVLALVLPNQRACMHLDTVFTMIDRDLFTVYPGIEETLEIYEVTYNGKEIETRVLTDGLKKVLEDKLGTGPIELVKQGKRGIIDASREQWSDGYNTLAIAPREVIVYERNIVTNELLEQHNVKLNYMPDGELSRGRGGPRCMSMPINRDAVKW